MPLLQAEEKAAMLADFQASYTALAAKHQHQLQSTEAALADIAAGGGSDTACSRNG